MSNRTITVRTSPSLALIKYWGKSDSQQNLPATSSLAVTLEGLYTDTTIKLHDTDQVWIDGNEFPIERYASFFENIRNQLNTSCKFSAKSQSNFPTSAGLASSSSGFAALAYGCGKLIDPNVEEILLSECARLGSASASRAIYGGFTTLPKESTHAVKLFDKTHWPELRIIIGITKKGTKTVSSRTAMETARQTSPYYTEWLKRSEDLFNKAVEACEKKDLATLGPLMQQSYLMMFSTMFTSSPPVIYWEPQSLRLIKACEELREKGFNVWETMDAGPQVKVVCLENETDPILDFLRSVSPETTFILSQPGEGPRIR